MKSDLQGPNPLSLYNPGGIIDNPKEEKEIPLSHNKLRTEKEKSGKKRKFRHLMGMGKKQKAKKTTGKKKKTKKQKERINNTNKEP